MIEAWANSFTSFVEMFEPAIIPIIIFFVGISGAEALGIRCILLVRYKLLLAKQKKV